jgi:hypothetical protein
MNFLLYFREAKGGYIVGTIKFEGLTTTDEIEEIQLDLVENRNNEVHPNVLYVSENERKEKRKKGGVNQVIILDI